MKLLKDWFTAPNNEHYELGRALWCLGTVALIAYQGYAIWQTKAFDPLQFGGAVAAILAAGGFGVAAKDKGARV